MEGSVELFALEEIRPLLIAIGAVAIPLLASYHIIVSKDDVRAAIGWAGLVWLVPFVGTILYLLFGINRIRRKAARKRRHRDSSSIQAGPPESHPEGEEGEGGEHSLSSLLPQSSEAMQAQAAMMDRITRMPLTPGNHIRLLEGGDEAYPEMLAAIGEAQKSIALATYIFDYDRAGRQFVAALKAAVERGVKVRVLIDGVGEMYHFPSSWRMLRRAGVPVQRFNRSIMPWRMAYLNLRNHRKILVVDGRIGFTGGMNLREGNFRDARPGNAIRDMHFRLEGPVAAHLMEVFAVDWSFAEGESLEGDAWFPGDLAGHRPGNAVARGVPDGPDEDLNKISWAILSGLGMARHSIKIVTPYFLPDRVLVAALSHAALRGVQVDIVLPERSNLKIVDWASRAQYGQLLDKGCHIHHLPPPFDHSKLLLVDDIWLLFGSSNWDPRSLRLNFEFNVECYDEALAGALAANIAERINRAKPVRPADVCAKHPLWRARDGIAWLFSPYL
jgi:cardiolipin synthase